MKSLVWTWNWSLCCCSFGLRRSMMRKTVRFLERTASNLKNELACTVRYVKEWNATYNLSHSYNSIQMGTALVSVILNPGISG